MLHISTRVRVILLVGVCLLVFQSAPAQIGAAAEKAAQRAALAAAERAATENAAKEAAGKSAVRNASVAAERLAWSNGVRHLDAQTVARIERRFGKSIGGRVQTPTPSTILSREEFDAFLRKRYPTLTEVEHKQILGVFSDNAAVMNGNHPQLPLTLAHERLHGLADARFRQTLGAKLDEGTTERLAQQVYGDLKLADLPPVYASEQELFDKLAARVGSDRLEAAYFRGDIASLRSAFDAQLERGAFDRFAAASRSGDLAAASRMLERR